MSGISRIDCDKVAAGGFHGSSFLLAPCAKRSAMPLSLFLPDSRRSAARSNGRESLAAL
jgi:hypothetical protein